MITPSHPVEDKDVSARQSHYEDLANELDAKAKALKNTDASHAELAEALVASRINPYSKRAIKLYLCLLVSFTAAVQNGFDGTIMSNINAMHQYLDYFGYSNAGVSTGFVFISYNIGNIIGAGFTGFICDHFGRKFGLFLYAVVITFSAAMAAASQNRAWFVATRMILGGGISLATTVGPVYATELAPPQWRGRAVGMYNSFYPVGAMVITGIMVGTTHIESTASWRIPLGLQAVPALIVLCTVWFIPESPRWLVTKGRDAEAEAILVELHGNGDPDNALVKLQMREIRANVEQDQADKAMKWYDFACLFNTHSARWRTLMVTLMSFFGQWSGNGIGYFLPVMYAGAGISSQSLQLLLSFVHNIESFIGAVIGAALTDKFGRRPRLIWGTLAITLTMVACFALTHTYGKGGPKAPPKGEKSAGASAGVFFLYMFSLVFAIVYTPLQALYCAEVLSTAIRAKGMAYHSICTNIAGLVSTFGISVALDRIQNYVYLVYVGWCLIETVIWYFFCVETRGFTLEELDEFFAAPNPVKASTSKRLEVYGDEVRADGMA